MAKITDKPVSPLSESVLYYPTIEFIDDNWVKNALLVWEKIPTVLIRNS